MKEKIILVLLVMVSMFLITGCGSDEEKVSDTPSDNIHEEQDINKKEEDNRKNENTVVDDDEIIEIDDLDNGPIEDERITVEKVINCEGCVYAYFDKEGENAKKLGDTLSKDEYTTDINNIRTKGDKQRHNFFGLVLSGNKITRAYSCILKNNKIYCIEGSTNGAYHSNNIAILKQIFTSSQCKTISNGNTFTCTDDSYNGDTRTSGYTSLHYETSCTIYGANSNTGKLICH